MEAAPVHDHTDTESVDFAVNCAPLPRKVIFFNQCHRTCKSDRIR